MLKKNPHVIYLIFQYWNDMTYIARYKNIYIKMSDAKKTLSFSSADGESSLNNPISAYYKIEDRWHGAQIIMRDIKRFFGDDVVIDMHNKIYTMKKIC